METHRHYSPKTVIILILTTVLSFAFVACNASKKCSNSGGYDKEACEKACNDVNGEDRRYSCHHACDKGKNINACSESCKIAYISDDGDWINDNGEDCRSLCDHGDADACEKYKLWQEVDARRTANWKEEAKKEAEEIAEKEKEACHVTAWQLNGDVPNQSISNLSWTRASISIPMDAAIDCAPATGLIEDFQNAVELGNRPNPIHLQNFSKRLLPCAKALNSTELQEVAKKCNGKWY